MIFNLITLFLQQRNLCQLMNSKKLLHGIRFKSLIEPDKIFENSNSLFSILFSLSFLMIMSSEILLNQPIKKKIKII